MPYVYMDELGEGMVEADVVERDIADSIADERDAAVTERDSLLAANESLARELDDAKAKFANAFLSSPEKMKSNQADDAKEEGKIQSFDELFKGRNKYNAN